MPGSSGVFSCLRPKSLPNSTSRTRGLRARAAGRASSSAISLPAPCVDAARRLTSSAVTRERRRSPRERGGDHGPGPVSATAKIVGFGLKHRPLADPVDQDSPIFDDDRHQDLVLRRSLKIEEVDVPARCCPEAVLEFGQPLQRVLMQDDQEVEHRSRYRRHLAWPSRRAARRRCSASVRRAVRNAPRSRPTAANVARLSRRQAQPPRRVALGTKRPLTGGTAQARSATPLHRPVRSDC